MRWARGWWVCTGVLPFTVVDLRSTAAGYLRVTQTGTSGSWWSVADLHVYR